jgi:processive 1,2-diacylglycerol beta-glucosyltransferase
MTSRRTSSSSASSERGSRVLLLYFETTGSGHKAAAEAVDAALHLRDSSVVTSALNVADYMSDAVRRSYHGLRALLIREAPHVLGQLYQWADGPREEPSRFDRLVKASQRAAFRHLARILQASDWDAIIHTHFFSPNVLMHMRAPAPRGVPQFIVTTDFLTHCVWVQPAFERSFVATEEAFHYLEVLGSPKERITLTGIPVHPDFARLRPARADFERRTAARAAELGRGDRPRVLLAATGFEPDFAANVLSQVAVCTRPLSIVVVAGANEVRRAAVDAVAIPDRHQVLRVGFTHEMPDLLAHADVLVGKAGGLTSSECLAMGCPMIVVGPTPDHEVQNVEWLLEHGAALTGHHAALLGQKIDWLFSSVDRWAGRRLGAYGLGRPQAAFDVADDVLRSAARHASAVRGPAASVDRKRSRVFPLTHLLWGTST